MRYYAATDNSKNSIWGIGTSENAAIKDAQEASGSCARFEVVKISEGLYKKIKTDGFLGPRDFAWIDTSRSVWRLKNASPSKT